LILATLRYRARRRYLWPGRFRSLRNGAPVSADARWGDSSPADAAACGSAARAVAARCVADSRNCCNDPAERPRRAASVRAQDIRDSNTAPSNRADIAFSFSSQEPQPRRRKGENGARRSSPYCKNTWKLAGLCAPASSESRKMYTITCGAVANSKPRGQRPVQAALPLTRCLVLRSAGFQPAPLPKPPPPHTPPFPHEFRASSISPQRATHPVAATRRI
jgi:hypothetical protein